MGDQEFVISRTLDAPRELVWKVYTEAEHLAQWWGPPGVPVSESRMDFRPGGTYMYGMATPGGLMWGKWVFREIVPPEKLVILVSFCDKDGNIKRHPMSANWPGEMLSTMILTEQERKTTLTITASAYNSSEIERETFKGGFESMTMGFNGSLDQLAAYLTKVKEG